MFKLSKQWTVAVLTFFFLRKRAVAIIRLLQTATVQYDIWWFFDSSPVVFKICAALKWGKKEWREGEELPLSFFPYPSHFFLLSHSHWLHPFWLLGTSQGIRWMLDCYEFVVGSFTNRRQDSNANAWGQVLSCLPQELIEKHEKTLFERDDIYTYYSNAFHVPFKRKWKLLVTNYENRPQILPLLAPGYSQTCDYLLVMEFFFSVFSRARDKREG